MKKETKIKILEISILLIIIITLIIITKLAFVFFNDKTNESTSNQTENYKKDKYTLYYKNISESSVYKVPYKNKIDTNASTYKVYIKSTDNVINGITEIITIEYTKEEPVLNEYGELVEPNPINRDTVHNFCNSYNEIEYSYKFICTYDNNRLILSNEFVIPNESLKNNKKNININIDQTRLDLYLKELDEKKINHITVEDIK